LTWADRVVGPQDEAACECGLFRWALDFDAFERRLPGAPSLECVESLRSRAVAAGRDDL